MTTGPAVDYRERMRGCAEAIELGAPAIVVPADHVVMLGDLQFHYLDWGNAHLPHLILLHGGGLTAHTWDMAALLLLDRYHLVALDLRGHGDTDWTPDEHIHDELNDLMYGDVQLFLDHLGYERVSLAGMSLGGVAAIRYAAEHPVGVEALVMVDVGPESMREAGQATQAFHHETDILERFEEPVLHGGHEGRGEGGEIRPDQRRGPDAQLHGGHARFSENGCSVPEGDRRNLEDLGCGGRDDLGQATTTGRHEAGGGEVHGAARSVGRGVHGEVELGVAGVGVAGVARRIGVVQRDDRCAEGAELASGGQDCGSGAAELAEHDTAVDQASG